VEGNEDTKDIGGELDEEARATKVDLSRCFDRQLSAPPPPGRSSSFYY